MSNQVNPSFSLTYTYGNQSEQINSKTYTTTPANPGFLADTINVQTTAGSTNCVALTGTNLITTPNYVFLANNDATNYCSFGFGTAASVPTGFTYQGRLLAGQMAFLPVDPVNSTVLYLLANTSPVSVEVKAISA